ncbi:lamin tail domain-containing protein, partial [Planctomycetota bacterium]
MIELSQFRHLLVKGANVLAIQGHNTSIGNSSDFVLAPVLQAITALPLPPESAPQTRVLVNEIYPGAQGWIELFNPGPVAVDLGRVIISPNPEDHTRQRLASRTLYPGDFLQVSAADIGFVLPQLDGSITLCEVSSADVITRVLDAVRYAGIPAGQSYGRYPSGANPWEFLTTPTAQAPNRYPFIHDIVINEIMYYHPTRDEGYEYVELLNRGPHTVSLKDWAFDRGITYTFSQDRHL